MYVRAHISMYMYVCTCMYVHVCMRTQDAIFTALTVYIFSILQKGRCWQCTRYTTTQCMPFPLLPLPLLLLFVLFTRIVFHAGIVVLWSRWDCFITKLGTFSWVTCMCMCLCMCMCMCLCMCICVCVYVYMCMCVCVWSVCIAYVHAANEKIIVECLILPELMLNVEFLLKTYHLIVD